MKYLPAAFLICGLAANIQAGTIAIPDFSFELPALAPGASSGFPYGPITGWAENQVSFTAYSAINSGPAQYPGGVPDGNQFAQVLADGTTAYIYQFLGTDLQANDTYTFSGYAGLRLDTGSFGPGLGCYGQDAAVEAGGNVLTPVVPGGDIACSSLSLGQFTKFSFTFSTGANPAGLGSPLEIVLTTNGSGSPYEPSEADFDAISLSDTLGSTSTVPEPETFIPVAGVLALALWLRRLHPRHGPNSW